jgi:hypothetical protein
LRLMLPDLSAAVNKAVGLSGYPLLDSAREISRLTRVESDAAAAGYRLSVRTRNAHLACFHILKRFVEDSLTGARQLAVLLDDAHSTEISFAKEGQPLFYSL